MSAGEQESRRGFLGQLTALSAGALVPQLARGGVFSRDTAAGDFMYDANLAYLQTGSLGPTPRPVMERTIAAWTELERNPVRYGYGEHEHAMEAVRAKAAALLGCPVETLTLTTCTTDGMNRVAQGLGLQRGDRVLTSDQEHPGGRVCWDYLVRTRGIVLDVVPITPGEDDGAAIVRRFADAITPRTKVLSVSHLLSSTGLRLPVAALAAAARARDVISVIDGAQAVGGIAVDVTALGCDVYVTSGHKWLLAPKGTGLMYVRAEARPRIDPIQWQSGPAAYTASSGVGNIPGVIGLGAAIDYLMSRDLRAIEVHNLALRQQVAAAIGRLPMLRAVSGTATAVHSPLVSYRLPDSAPAGALAQRLLERHGVVVKTVPGQWFNGHRISTHLFNTGADVERLAAALRAELT